MQSVKLWTYLTLSDHHVDRPEAEGLLLKLEMAFNYIIQRHLYMFFALSTTVLISHISHQ